MFDDEVRQLLESQGPWTIHIDEIAGKVCFNNGSVSVKIEPEVEEAMDSAPGIKWNVEYYNKTNTLRRS
jgi:hypothetical protein